MDKEMTTQGTTAARFPQETLYAGHLETALRALGRAGYLATHPVRVTATGYDQVEVHHEDGHFVGRVIPSRSTPAQAAACIYEQVLMSVPVRATFALSLHPAGQGQAS